MTENAIQLFLDLHGIPWRESLETLVGSHGVRDGPYTYNRRSVLLDRASRPFPKMTHPLSFRYDDAFEASLPPVRFDGQFELAFRRSWLSSSRPRIDAAFRSLVQSLEVDIGPAATDHDHGLALWQSGPSSIEIRHPDLRDNRLPANRHGRCSIGIETGFRPACSEIERRWLETCAPHVRLGPPVGSALVAKTPARQFELEYVREPCAGMERTDAHICLSQDEAAILFTTHQLHVVPRDRIRGVQIIQGEAKFDIRSEVAIMCAAGGWPKGLTVRTADQPGALDDFGRDLAAWLGVPFAIVR